MLIFQFVEENEGSRNGEDKSNATAVQIEDDGPSETFKDEESKVSQPKKQKINKTKFTVNSHEIVCFDFGMCMFNQSFFRSQIEFTVQYTHRWTG